jgi:ERCC4-related helicase
MNIIERKIKESFSEDNYLNIYYNIFDNILSNSKILVINQHLLFSISKLGHYIKKYNLHITFYIDNENDNIDFLNKIKGEEYENNISTTKTILFNKDNNFDFIIVFHVYDKRYLNTILNSIKDNITYKFDKVPSTIFIFDEVHRCSNLETENNKMLFAAKLTNMPILILSATIADFPEKFKPFFYILNFIDIEQVKSSNIDVKKYMRIMDEWIFRDNKPLVRIHKMLYPLRASRMRIDVLGDLFPETQITATPYTLDEKRRLEIEKEYKNLYQELEEIRKKKNVDKPNPLTITMRAHQKIEILKIPLFVELCNDFRHNNYSVVIFVNFTKTLEMLCEMLHTTSKIYGEQTMDERMKIIEDFQSNKTNIIICNIKAGGIGISLHDIHGGYPRVSLISPTWSSIDLVQALGRIHRAGGKSKSLQRILYTADTVEEKIADKLKTKLLNINSINNGDLDLTNINFENNRKKI